MGPLPSGHRQIHQGGALIPGPHFFQEANCLRVQSEAKPNSPQKTAWGQLCPRVQTPIFQMPNPKFREMEREAEAVCSRSGWKRTQTQPTQCRDPKPFPASQLELSLSWLSAWSQAGSSWLLAGCHRQGWLPPTVGQKPSFAAAEGYSSQQPVAVVPTPGSPPSDTQPCLDPSHPVQWPPQRQPISFS